MAGKFKALSVGAILIVITGTKRLDCFAVRYSRKHLNDIVKMS